jgi:hypothetical protein
VTGRKDRFVRRCGHGVASLALLVAAAACSSPSNSTQCLGTAHGGISLDAVALDYPEPSATGVPTSIGVLVLSSSVTTPIQIVNVDASGAQAPVDAAPTALPVPLPNPIATPIPGSGSTYFAVAVPSLAPGSTYRVLAATNEPNVGCTGEVTQGALEIAGQFTTQ